MLAQLAPGLAARYWRIELGGWMRQAGIHAIDHDNGHALRVHRRPGAQRPGDPLSARLVDRRVHPTAPITLGRVQLGLLAEYGWEQPPGTWQTMDLICQHYAPVLGAGSTLHRPARIGWDDAEQLRTAVAYSELGAMVDYLRTCAGTGLRLLHNARGSASALEVHGLYRPLNRAEASACRQVCDAASPTLLYALTSRDLLDVHITAHGLEIRAC